MFQDLIDAATRADRVLRKALADDADQAAFAEALKALGALRSQIDRGAFWACRAEDEQGTDWSAKVWAAERSLKVAGDWPARRKALAAALRDLGPLTGKARAASECFA